MQRSYTVEEIDELRRLVRNRLLFGRCELGEEMQTSFNQVSVEDIEATVRTHMLAGHTAADLLATETPKR